MIRYRVLLAAAVLGPATFAQSPDLVDLSMHSTEAKAIKNLVAQGVMTPTAPGKFDPAAPMKRGDFALALRRLFNLPQPATPVKFSDVHPTDTFYPAIQAVSLYMDKQVPTPAAAAGNNFSPDKHLSRAESAGTLVRILIAQNRLQLVSGADADKVLSTVPDAKDVAKRTRPYIATAIPAGILDCCAGNTLEATQVLSRADTAEILDNVQRRFDIPLVKQGT